MVCNVVLTIDFTNNHSLYDIEGCLRVVMWTFALDINQIVTAKEEFRDVSSKIVDQVEFTARVIPVISFQVEDEIVKDHKLSPCFDSDVNLFGCVALVLIVFFDF